MTSVVLFSLNSSFISHLSLIFLEAAVENILMKRVQNAYHYQFLTYRLILIMIN